MSIFLKQNVCRSPVSYIFYNCRRGQGGRGCDGLDYDTSMLYSHTHTHTHTYIRLMALCVREGGGFESDAGVHEGTCAG